jgi:16S rRNA (guanine(527)-N(7))-methyltransferase RsmG
VSTRTWENFPERFRLLASQYSLPASEEFLSRCVHHLELLRKWNRKMNLVGDLSPDSVLERHYGEALWLASHLPEEATAIADIGSGAGFPGIVLAAARPTTKVYLIESREKRAVFLRESTREWRNCQVLHSIVENVGVTVDFVTSRAVAADLLLSTAERLSAGVGLLVATDATAELESFLTPKGYRCRSFPVPWRPASSAFVAFNDVFHMERST